MSDAIIIFLLKLVPLMFLVIAFVAVAMNIGIDFQAVLNAEYLMIATQNN